MKQLEGALKYMKKDKERDPNGLINELLKMGWLERTLTCLYLDFLTKLKMKTLSQNSLDWLMYPQS